VRTRRNRPIGAQRFSAAADLHRAGLAEVRLRPGDDALDHLEGLRDLGLVEIPVLDRGDVDLEKRRGGILASAVEVGVGPRVPVAVEQVAVVADPRRARAREPALAVADGDVDLGMRDDVRRLRARVRGEETAAFR